VALRFMQIFVPENTDVNLDQLMEGHDVIGAWRDSSVPDRIVLPLLCRPKKRKRSWIGSNRRLRKFLVFGLSFFLLKRSCRALRSPRSPPPFNPGKTETRRRNCSEEARKNSTMT
jgi:hypothetical protein